MDDKAAACSTAAIHGSQDRVRVVRGACRSAQASEWLRCLSRATTAGCCATRSWLGRPAQPAGRLGSCACHIPACTRPPRRTRQPAVRPARCAPLTMLSAPHDLPPRPWPAPNTRLHRRSACSGSSRRRGSARAWAPAPWQSRSATSRGHSQARPEPPPCPLALPRVLWPSQLPPRPPLPPDSAPAAQSTGQQFKCQLGFAHTRRYRACRSWPALHLPGTRAQPVTHPSSPLPLSLRSRLLPTYTCNFSTNQAATRSAWQYGP